MSALEPQPAPVRFLPGARALVRRDTNRVHVASFIGDDSWLGICGRTVYAEPVCSAFEASAWAVDNESALCHNCREMAITIGGPDA